MTVNAVRLNHAVLFVADLDRVIAFYDQAFGMTVVAREPRANAAFLRLPRSGNHHDLGLFGVGAPAAAPRAARSACTTWPGRSTPSTSSRRPAQTLADPGALTGESSHGATKSVYGADPDGNEFEVMWMLPRDGVGRVRERRARSTASTSHAEVARWAGVRTAGRARAAAVDARHDQAFAPPVVATAGVDRPGRAPGRAAARPRVERARHHRPGRPPPRRTGLRRRPRTDRRRRRVRLVRQPRHRPARRRVAGRHHGLVPAWLDDVAPAGRPVVLVGFSGGAAFAGGLLLDDPTRYAGAAILYGTLPFDAGVPTTPARLAGVPVFVAHGDADTVIPRELLDRTWHYLLGESGAAPSHGATPAATAIAPTACASWPVGSPRARLPAQRGHPGRARRRGRPCPTADCRRVPAPGPRVSWTIPQQQERHRPGELQEQLFARIAACPG